MEGLLRARSGLQAWWLRSWKVLGGYYQGCSDVMSLGVFVGIYLAGTLMMGAAAALLVKDSRGFITASRQLSFFVSSMALFPGMLSSLVGMVAGNLVGARLPALSPATS